MFSKEDLKQIGDRGSDLDYINEQISFFIDGFPDIDIVAPATVGNGIIDLSDDYISHYQKIYMNFEGDIVKFVPASGAATRMFKDLYQALESIKVEENYYVIMMGGWLLSECFICYPKQTIEFIKTHEILPAILNKGIQKCRESNRLTQTQKDDLLIYKKKRR